MKELPREVTNVKHEDNEHEEVKMKLKAETEKLTI